MKEIKQADLKPFPELRKLILHYNLIEVLEDGLFDFNPKLKFISFWSSNIFHIDQNVFANLNHLAYLWLKNNKCINDWAKDSSSDIQAFISRVKVNCYDLDFVEVRKNLKELERDVNLLGHDNYKQFNEKLNKSEVRFNNSKFSYYLLFQDKFQSIKTDTKYVEFSNFNIFQNQIKKLNPEQNKIMENVDKCYKVCDPDIQNLDTFLKSTISSVSALSQRIDNFECKNEQKNVDSDQNSTETDEFDEIRNKLSLIEDKIDNQESILNEFYNKLDDIVN